MNTRRGGLNLAEHNEDQAPLTSSYVRQPHSSRVDLPCSNQTGGSGNEKAAFAGVMLIRTILWLVSWMPVF